MPYADPEAKKANDRAYGSKNATARKERARAWRAAQRERDGEEAFRRRTRGYYLKWRFGITLDQYDQMLKDQAGVCAICGTTNTAPRDTFCVDHCHATGAVRGLLCHKCNVCIGQAADDPQLLRKAVAYLERS